MFYVVSLQETYDNILAMNYTIEEPEFASVSKEAKDFIASLIVSDQDERMSAEEALNHKWLQPRQLSENQQLETSKKLQNWKKCTNVVIACSRFKVHGSK